MKKNAEPLLQELNDFGGYPVLNDNWDEGEFDWMDTIIQMRQKGYDQDILADISVVTDAKNSSVHIIDVRFEIYSYF